MATQVKSVPVTRLRRGDPILAIRWCGCGKREAGCSKKSRVLGHFTMRHPRGEDEVAVVYRRAQDDAVVGHQSSYPRDAIAFVLREVN